MSRVHGSLTTHLPASDRANSLTPISSPAHALRRQNSADDLAELRRKIERALAECLQEQQPAWVKASIFAPLYTELADFIARPGKRLRPLLFLLGHRMFWQDASDRAPRIAESALYQVAVSLELLHSFILVHDDIIDRAETRRGLPTLHRLLENRFSSVTDRPRASGNLALVLGDLLFALAQKCLLEATLPPEMTVRLGSMLLNCMIETGFGEVADILYSARDVSKVEPAEIERMYCLKTTCYTIEGPLQMAAMLAGHGEDVLEALGRVARPAGLAFQIQNDLQEFARFEVSDAEVPADFLEGKKTLLVRTAFERLNEVDRALLQLCFSTSAPTEGTVSMARDLVVKCGAVSELTLRMDQLFAEAVKNTRWAGFSPDLQKELAGLLGLVRRASAGV